MSKFPWFQFFASDWLGSTNRALMTLAEQGAYINLLAHQWGDERCCLPDDDDVLAALSELRGEWFKGTSRVLRECFPPHPTIEGTVANPKLLEIWETKAEQRRKSSEGGKKSAYLRSQAKGTSSPLEVPLQDPSNKNPTTRSRSRSIKPPPPTPSVPGDQEDNGWLEVEVLLRNLNLADAPGAVKAARARRLTPDYVRRLTAHYEARAGAWGPGSLKWRIQHGSPNDDPTAMWPEVSDDYRGQQANAARQATGTKRRAEVDAVEKEREQEERESAKLEAAAGKQLDAMSDDDAEALARVVLNTVALNLYLKNGRTTPLARPVLLEYLANEKRPAT